MIVPEPPTINALISKLMLSPELVMLQTCTGAVPVLLIAEVVKLEGVIASEKIALNRMGKKEV